MKYRHGDVLLKSIDSIPVGVNKLKHLTLAEGEVTGHSHQITEGEAELYEKDGILFLSVKSETASLTHEEHKKIVLPKGDFEITIQKEYTPEGWRRVAD